MKNLKKSWMTIFSKIWRYLFPKKMPDPIPNPPEPPIPPSKTNSQIIFEKAISFLGKDASPKDEAPDELACVESFCDVVRAAGFSLPDLLYTPKLKLFFASDAYWRYVPDDGNWQGGRAILCVTGEGGKNGITNGHVGITGKGGIIMSNDSKTGNWLENYTIDKWRERYEKLGGYKTYFFEHI